MAIKVIKSKDTNKEEVKTIKQPMSYCSINNTYVNYEHKDKKDIRYISEKKYKEVLHKFFKMLSYVLITSGKSIALPALLGNVAMMKRKPHRRLVDHGASNKEGKTIYFDLSKTNGYIPMTLWNKQQLQEAIFLDFELIRSTKRINTYHKTHAPVRMYEFFNQQGYLTYPIYDFGNILKTRYANTTPELLPEPSEEDKQNILNIINNTI